MQVGISHLSQFGSCLHSRACCTEVGHQSLVAVITHIVVLDVLRASGQPGQECQATDSDGC